MSTFRILEMSYESSSWSFDDSCADSRSMAVAIGKVLLHKTRGAYTYDFDSSTELFIESKKLYSAPANRRDLGRIRVLARNIALEFVCDTCGKPPSFLQLDEEDMWEQRHYCNSHQPDEEDFVYPLVNSPRCRVCDYVGDRPFGRIAPVHLSPRVGSGPMAAWVSVPNTTSSTQ